MRDRLISIGLSQPPRIRHEDFNVKTLEIEDFETSVHTTSAREITCRCDPCMRTSMCDHDTRIQFAEIFMSNVKLCTIIGSILSSQYSSHMRTTEAWHGEGGSPSTVMLFPNSVNIAACGSSGESSNIFAVLDNALAQWYDSLPTSIRLVQFQDEAGLYLEQMQRKFKCHNSQTGSRNSRCQQLSPKPSSLIVQAAVLQLSYHASVSALHRPRNNTISSKSRIAESAKATARVCALLNSKDLARYLPVNTVPMLFPSLVWNALFVKASIQRLANSQGGVRENGEAERARDNISEVFASLIVLQDIYVGAEVFVGLLYAFLRRVRMNFRSDRFQSHSKQRPQRRYELYSEFDKSNLHAPSGLPTDPSTYTSITTTQNVSTTGPHSTMGVQTHNTGIANRLSEHQDLLDHATGSDLENDGDTWHSMFNFTAFDEMDLVESWEINDFGTSNAQDQIDQIGAATWNDIGLNWRS